MDFSTLVSRVRTQSNNLSLPKRLLALDPGETTGWSFFYTRNEEKLEVYLGGCGQLETKERGAQEVEKLIDKWRPELVVIEDYKVYGWKTKQHSWSSLYTPRLIGAIELMCAQRGIPVEMQMAQQAKNFCTNEKLMQWGFYKLGEKHARDAIRHGCYWLLFGKIERR